jgi:hypothetical protein
VLSAMEPGKSPAVSGCYLALFLARFASFFSLALLAGAFLVCFFEFCDLAILCSLGCAVVNQRGKLAQDNGVQAGQ